MTACQVECCVIAHVLVILIFRLPDCLHHMERS